MQEIRGRKWLGARVRGLFEFERDLERDRQSEPAANNRSNRRGGKRARQLSGLFAPVQDAADASWHHLKL